ncbi:prohormone-1-like [Centruroides vittatus]|uniref:prohormone-1-like n=1 Tax=Centruroides vittatus TaxID=120091 RepID=UPI0035105EE1
MKTKRLILIVSLAVNLISNMSPVALRVAILSMALFCVVYAKSIGQEKAIPFELDFTPDDGSPETAIMNYLFARQMVNRIRNNLDISDLQRKRSYWKQCAFNAVSCFGRK